MPALQRSQAIPLAPRVPVVTCLCASFPPFLRMLCSINEVDEQYRNEGKNDVRTSKTNCDDNGDCPQCPILHGQPCGLIVGNQDLYYRSIQEHLFALNAMRSRRLRGGLDAESGRSSAKSEFSPINHTCQRIRSVGSGTWLWHLVLELGFAQGSAAVAAFSNIRPIVTLTMY